MPHVQNDRRAEPERWRHRRAWAEHRHPVHALRALPAGGQHRLLVGGRTTAPLYMSLGPSRLGGATACWGGAYDRKEPVVRVTFSEDEVARYN